MTAADRLTDPELEALRSRVAELELAEAGRSRVAEALSESETRFRTLVANMPGTVYRSEAVAPWRDSFLTEDVFDLCGHSADELTRHDGIAFGDLVLSEDQAGIETSIAKAIESGGTFEIRYRIRHADGRIRWIQDNGRVAVSRDGIPMCLDGVVVDITDRVEAENALRHSEERFRTLVANVPGTVYRSALAHPFRDVFVSDGVSALTGYSAAEFMRPDGQSFGNLTLPEDQPMVGREVAQAVEQTGTFEVRYRVRHRDGSVRWLHDSGRVSRGADGTPLWLDGVVIDITERMRAEESLRESEARYRTIVASVPGAVYLCQTQHPWEGIFMSAGVEALTGYQLKEFIAPGKMSFNALTVAEDRENVKALVETAVETRTPFTIRYRIRHADGSLRWVYEQGQAAYGAEGRALFLGGVILDITDRMRVEEELRQSEERFRTLVGSVPGAVYRCEVAFPYRTFLLSEGVRAISGFGPEEFLPGAGQTLGELILHEDRQMVDGRVCTGVREHRPFEVDYRIRHADGQIRWIQEQGQASYGPDGAPVWLDGVMTDVTARIAAEEALRASKLRLVEAQRIAKTGSWEADLLGVQMHWSQECYRIYERDPQSFTPTLANALAIVHPEDRELVRQRLFDSLQNRSPFEMGHRLLMPEGRVKFVRQRAEIVTDAGGAPPRMLGTINDVTDRVEADAAHADLETQLRQAQKMEAIGTLAGGIAHDFNNILTAVIGHAELLAHDLPVTSSNREGIAGILTASLRARDLVQQILTFSRLQELERRRIAIDPVVLEALKLLRATLPATIEIHTDVALNSGLVFADATQIHQLVVNLGTNAAHAMRERGGVLTVSCYQVLVDEELARTHPRLTPGPWIRLEIRDTGHGMDEVTKQRIFDPFFTTKAPGEGTGLGLAVVHGIMQSHDGAVIVSSEPEQGTVFQLYFPVVAGRPTAVAVEQAPPPRGAGQHLLVVDDEPALAGLAARSLKQLGYRVTSHTDAAKALADFLARPDEFDLVLSDLTMPHLTGIDLAERILELRPEIPVLLISGYTGSLDPAELRRRGIRELVGKPYLAHTIAEAIARHLGEPVRSEK
jgi:PAS domain S-box-containing protein